MVDHIIIHSNQQLLVGLTVLLLIGCRTAVGNRGNRADGLVGARGKIPVGVAAVAAADVADADAPPRGGSFSQCRVYTPRSRQIAMYVCIYVCVLMYARMDG